MTTPVIFAGIEGGATNTTLVLLDDKGTILSRAQGSGSNGYVIGIPAVADVLLSLLQEAVTIAHLPPLPTPMNSDPFTTLRLGAFGACMSGFLQPGPQQELISLLQQRAPSLTSTYYIDNDSPGSIYTVAGNAGGCVMIAGTGSMGQLIVPGQPPVNCGGHGHMYGDEGSAYNIAADAIRHIFRHLDHFTEFDETFYTTTTTDEISQSPPDATLACKAMLEYFQITEPEGMLTVMYGPAFSKARVAGFTKQLAYLATQPIPDLFAIWVFARAGRQLGATLRALVRRAKLDIQAIQANLIDASKPAGAAIPSIAVVAVGSVWKSWPLLQRSFIQAATASFTVTDPNVPTGSHAYLSGFRLVRLHETSAIGAAYYASQCSSFGAFPLDSSNYTEELYRYSIDK